MCLAPAWVRQSIHTWNGSPVKGAVCVWTKGGERRATQIVGHLSRLPFKGRLEGGEVTFRASSETPRLPASLLFTKSIIIDRFGRQPEN